MKYGEGKQMVNIHEYYGLEELPLSDKRVQDYKKVKVVLGKINYKEGFGHREGQTILKYLPSR